MGYVAWKGKSGSNSQNIPVQFITSIVSKTIKSTFKGRFIQKSYKLVLLPLDISPPRKNKWNKGSRSLVLPYNPPPPPKKKIKNNNKNRKINKKRITLPLGKQRTTRQHVFWTLGYFWLSSFSRALLHKSICLSRRPSARSMSVCPVCHPVSHQLPYIKEPIIYSALQRWLTITWLFTKYIYKYRMIGIVRSDSLEHTQ